MYSYAGQSATATKVTQFREAPQITNDPAQTAQTSAVANATGSSTAGNAQSTLSQVVTSTPNTLQAAAQPAATTSGPPTSTYGPLWYLLTGQTLLPTSLGQFLNGYSPFAGFFYNTEGLPYFSVGMGNSVCGWPRPWA